ncbi:hypothetical protein PPL_04250 [Heterostelium album PN500]|uniref:Uncharacterized protein n=1 Tax=Heterostelium pallidum (strain ATCC 26659 / Pp 5 / PN500) TaxID=670386 RepID=D3B719_HETP5|nr:hypothetical protein PPL_04250 [Heterostelium album PN500]EFA82562.1 hypothetical protein PPL_04250 [Heterostelium album PN500]|eukprot:XP_020434679.1 hypothetical protein PPL_04250 [Heterostelium album PN500]
MGLGGLFHWNSTFRCPTCLGTGSSGKVDPDTQEKIDHSTIGNSKAKNPKVEMKSFSGMAAEPSLDIDPTKVPPDTLYMFMSIIKTIKKYWKQLHCLISCMISDEPVKEYQWRYMSSQFGSNLILADIKISTYMHIFIVHVGLFLERYGNLEYLHKPQQQEQQQEQQKHEQQQEQQEQQKQHLSNRFQLVSVLYGVDENIDSAYYSWWDGHIIDYNKKDNTYRVAFKDEVIANYYSVDYITRQSATESISYDRLVEGRYKNKKTLTIRLLKTNEIIENVNPDACYEFFIENYQVKAFFP